MPEYPSGTVAFLFTDIEGSTRRWEANRQAMWEAVERHFALLHTAIAAQNGVLFKTIGDAVQAAFPSVPAGNRRRRGGAVGASAKKIGAILGPLRVRMGIHVGEAAPKMATISPRRSTGIQRESAFRASLPHTRSNMGTYESNALAAAPGAGERDAQFFGSSRKKN